MKRIKIFLLIATLPLLTAASLHKFYVSVTEVEYVKKQNSVQIITRLFVDDLELVLRKRYNDQLQLSPKNESKEASQALQRYLNEKLQIKINGETKVFNFIGKEYDVDIVYCYLEIKNVKEISSFEITNKLLFDGFEDQQNIVKTNINSENKSFIFTVQNDKGLLNFE